MPAQKGFSIFVSGMCHELSILASLMKFLEKGARSRFCLQNSGKFTIIHVPLNRIPICFLFRGMVRNKIPRVLLQFVPRYGIPSIFLSAEWVRNGIRDFSVSSNRRNSIGINQFFRLFRLPQNNFFVRNCQPYFRCSSGPHGEDTSLKTNILGLFLRKLNLKIRAQM
jgi:hypothetical protein